jgi:hypothetical protein
MISTGEIIFLASAFADRANAAIQGERFDSKDMLLGATIVLIIGLALFLFVYLRSRKKSNDADQARLAQMTQSHNSGAGSERRERRRKRRRRRDHRPRNPSLDKTGGLPPQRPDDQLPKF